MIEQAFNECLRVRVRLSNIIVGVFCITLCFSPTIKIAEISF